MHLHLIICLTDTVESENIKIIIGSQVYEERLKIFHLDLERRGPRGIRIEVYKVMSDMIKVGVSGEGSTTQLKLIKKTSMVFLQNGFWLFPETGVGILIPLPRGAAVQMSPKLCSAVLCLSVGKVAMVVPVGLASRIPKSVRRFLDALDMFKG